MTAVSNRVTFRIAKNYRSKSVWTLFQRKLFNNQTVWPVIFGFTGPICARALKSFHLRELRAARGSRLARQADYPLAERMGMCSDVICYRTFPVTAGLDMPCEKA